MLGGPCFPCCGGAGACECSVVPTQILAELNAFPVVAALPALTYDTLPDDMASRFPPSVLVSAILTRDDSIALHGGYGYRYFGEPLAGGPDLYDSGDGHVLRRNAIDIRFWFYPAENHPTLSPVVSGTTVCYRFGMSYSDGWLWETHPTDSDFQFGRLYTVDDDPEWYVVAPQESPQVCLELRFGGSLAWETTQYNDNWQFGATPTPVTLTETMAISIS